jgi:hypothetical protein
VFARTPLIADDRPVAAVEFTVLERRVVTGFVGRDAAGLAARAAATFRDLDARPGLQPTADLQIDTDDASEDVLLERLAQELCDWAITARREDLLMMHAGAVAEPLTGAAVGLVGPSGAGKSTAVRTLGRRWGYLGDEVLAITSDVRVVPLPKPVSLILPGRSCKAQVPAGDLGLVPAPKDPRLAALVLLDRRSTTSVDLVPVPTVDALALLAPQISYLGLRPQPLHWVADHLERVGGLLRVTYEECADLADVVGDLMADGFR